MKSLQPAPPAVSQMPKAGDVQGSPTAVDVMVPLALPQLLTYLLPYPVPAGTWVEVQVGTKTYNGIATTAPSLLPQKLKQAKVVEDVPALHPTTLAFYRWVARYTLSAPGEPLRVALPKAHIPPLPKTAKAQKALETPWKINEATPPTLNPAQKEAVDLLQAEDTFKTTLLDGVTGSGKTEVYFALLPKLLEAGKQVLILVPEIALTPQWIDRFGARFGVPPLVWHSNLAAGARAATWHRVARGEPVVVLGARSALFLPFQNLGLVVVDEEHDPSYKQGEAFRYHGRDAAIQLARSWGAPAVLASATPSLETFHHAGTGKYQHLILPTRHGGATMPTLRLINLKENKTDARDYLATPLREAMQKRLDDGQQTLLFLNRRGNAPLLLCTSCGTRRDCPNCDATLVVHGDETRCHHCGYREPTPDICPSCESPDMRAYGPGTRSLAQEAQRVFPNARIAVADSDTTGTTGKLAELMNELAEQKIDIIIGTQMLTKGHHLPHLTLVGVIDADMSLAHGDARAAERTYQLLAQVAGRAGRAKLAGEVLIQTFNPTHPLFKALLSGDRDTFYGEELENRKTFGDPPFGRALALQLSGLEDNLTLQAARQLAQSFAHYFPKKEGTPTVLLGPAPALIKKIRNRYRYRLLVKAPAHNHAQILKWIESTPLPKNIRLDIDIDPVSES